MHRTISNVCPLVRTIHRHGASANTWLGVNTVKNTVTVGVITERIGDVLHQFQIITNAVVITVSKVGICTNNSFFAVGNAVTITIRITIRSGIAYIPMPIIIIVLLIGIGY